MITLKHRSASGSLESMWDYDSARKAVIVVVEGRGFDVPVCLDKDDHRTAGSFVITRLTEYCWRIAPCMCLKHRGHWVTVPWAYPDSNELAEFLCLTHAPEDISALLGAL